MMTRHKAMLVFKALFTVVGLCLASSSTEKDFCIYCDLESGRQYTINPVYFNKEEDSQQYMQNSGDLIDNQNPSRNDWPSTNNQPDWSNTKTDVPYYQSKPNKPSLLPNHIYKTSSVDDKQYPLSDIKNQHNLTILLTDSLSQLDSKEQNMPDVQNDKLSKIKKFSEPFCSILKWPFSKSLSEMKDHQLIDMLMNSLNDCKYPPEKVQNFPPIISIVMKKLPEGLDSERKVKAISQLIAVLLLSKDMMGDYPDLQGKELGIVFLTYLKKLLQGEYQDNYKNPLASVPTQKPLSSNPSKTFVPDKNYTNNNADNSPKIPMGLTKEQLGDSKGKYLDGSMYPDNYGANRQRKFPDFSNNQLISNRGNYLDDELMSSDRATNNNPVENADILSTDIDSKSINTNNNEDYLNTQKPKAEKLPGIYNNKDKLSSTVPNVNNSPDSDGYDNPFGGNYNKPYINTYNPYGYYPNYDGHDGQDYDYDYDDNDDDGNDDGHLDDDAVDDKTYASEPVSQQEKPIKPNALDKTYPSSGNIFSQWPQEQGNLKDNNYTLDQKQPRDLTSTATPSDVPEIPDSKKNIAAINALIDRVKTIMKLLLSCFKDGEFDFKSFINSMKEMENTTQEFNPGWEKGKVQKILLADVIYALITFLKGLIKANSGNMQELQKMAEMSEITPSTLQNKGNIPQVNPIVENLLKGKNENLKQLTQNIPPKKTVTQHPTIGQNIPITQPQNLQEINLVRKYQNEQENHSRHRLVPDIPLNQLTAHQPVPEQNRASFLPNIPEVNRNPVYQARPLNQNQQTVPLNKPTIEQQRQNIPMSFPQNPQEQNKQWMYNPNENKNSFNHQLELTQPKLIPQPNTPYIAGILNAFPQPWRQPQFMPPQPPLVPPNNNKLQMMPLNQNNPPRLQQEPMNNPNGIQNGKQFGFNFFPNNLNIPLVGQPGNPAYIENGNQGVRYRNSNQNYQQNYQQQRELNIPAETNNNWNSQPKIFNTGAN